MGSRRRHGRSPCSTPPRARSCPPPCRRDAHHRRRDGARLGRSRRRVRQRRRLHRPPVVRRRPARPRARGRRLPRRHPAAAPVAERRRVPPVRPPAPLLRGQRRQHGLDDQPLHGEQEAAQRRRLFARWPHRTAPRPRHQRLRAALPRGVQGRAGDRRRRRGVAAPRRPLRLLVGDREAVDPRHVEGRPGRLRHGRARARRDLQAPRRRASDPDCRDLRGVAYLLGAKETLPRTSGTTPRATTRRSSCRASRTSPPTRSRSPRDAADPPRDQPEERPAPRAEARRSPAGRQSAGAGARRARHGPHLRPALHAQGRTRATRARRSRRTR
jgi:hypothetical protein